MTYLGRNRDTDVTNAAKPVCAMLLIDANKLMRSLGVLGQFPLMSKLVVRKRLITGQIIL